MAKTFLPKTHILEPDVEKKMDKLGRVYFIHRGIDTKTKKSLASKDYGANRQTEVPSDFK